MLSLNMASAKWISAAAWKVQQNHVNSEPEDANEHLTLLHVAKHA